MKYGIAYFILLLFSFNCLSQNKLAGDEEDWIVTKDSQRDCADSNLDLIYSYANSIKKTQSSKTKNEYILALKKFESACQFNIDGGSGKNFEFDYCVCENSDEIINISKKVYDKLYPFIKVIEDNEEKIKEKEREIIKSKQLGQKVVITYDALKIIYDSVLVNTVSSQKQLLIENQNRWKEYYSKFTQPENNTNLSPNELRELQIKCINQRSVDLWMRYKLKEKIVKEEFIK